MAHNLGLTGFEDGFDNVLALGCLDHCIGKKTVHPILCWRKTCFFCINFPVDPSNAWKDKIMQTNPVLESFGNAMTVAWASPVLVAP